MYHLLKPYERDFSESWERLKYFDTTVSWQIVTLFYLIGHTKRLDECVSVFSDNLFLPETRQNISSGSSILVNSSSEVYGKGYKNIIKKHVLHYEKTRREFENMRKMQ